MQPKKKSKSNKSNGVGYGGGKNDEQNMKKGLEKATKRQESIHDETKRYLTDIQFQFTKVDNWDFLSQFVSSMGSTCFQTDSTRSNYSTVAAASNSSNTRKNKKAKVSSSSSSSSVQPKPISPTQKLQETLKEVFRTINPTEWDSPQKSQLVQLALSVCNAIVSLDLQIIQAIFGPHKDVSSLSSLLKSITVQAKMIARRVVDLEEGGEGKEEEVNTNQNQQSNQIMQDVSIATYFLQVQEKVEQAMEQIAYLNQKCKPSSTSTIDSNISTSSTDSSSASIKEQKYKQKLEPLRLDFVDELQNHHFITKTKTKTTPNSRLLYKELISYSTALPIEYGSSIFVRVLNAKLNMLRVLIIGPEGTPYANGCFFFDVYIPGEYPQVPPKVQFLTTGNGKVRFNPNLYNCGKVCLSLLGTWSGPGWTAGQSTVLQVLLSIQSLIFVPDPYFNEPGYESSRGTSAGNKESSKYNCQRQHDTILYGLLEHFKFVKTYMASVGGNTSSNSGAKSPYESFVQIMAHHFMIKNDNIQKQLLEWKQVLTPASHKAIDECLDLLNDLAVLYIEWEGRLSGDVGGDILGNNASSMDGKSQAKAFDTGSTNGTTSSATRHGGLNSSDYVITLRESDDEDDDIEIIEEPIQISSTAPSRKNKRKAEYHPQQNGLSHQDSVIVGLEKSHSYTTSRIRGTKEQVTSLDDVIDLT